MTMTVNYGLFTSFNATTKHKYVFPFLRQGIANQTETGSIGH